MKTIRWLALSMSFVICSCANPPSIEWAEGDVWPEERFAESKPSERGFDETLFSDAIKDYASSAAGAYEILVVKDGYRVFGACRYPYPEGYPHAVCSYAKSVLSLLVGIAAREGILPDIDESVSRWFPQVSEYGHEKITLRHLLEMKSGLSWHEDPYSSDCHDYGKMLDSPDPIRFLLDRESSSEPGTTFQYNSGTTFLLGLVLEKASGMKLIDFAQKHLFSILGIESYYWETLPDGSGIGGSGLYLDAASMAKIGLLASRGGRWKDTQVIPRWWMVLSTAAHTSFSQFFGQDGYGFLWWRNAHGGFSARGFGGQYILVYPEYDLVIVTTGDLHGPEFSYPESVLANGIIDSLGAGEGREDPEGISEALSFFRREP